MQHALSPEQLQARVQTCAFDLWLGLTVIDFGDDGLTMRIPKRKEMSGNPVTGTLHGGILSCVVDAVGCYHLIGTTGGAVATVDLSIDYLRPARGDLVAKSHLLKRGRKISVVEVKIFDPDSRLIASGRIACMPLAAGGSTEPA